MCTFGVLGLSCEAPAGGPEGVGARRGGGLKGWGLEGVGA